MKRCLAGTETAPIPNGQSVGNGGCVVFIAFCETYLGQVAFVLWRKTGFVCM